MTEEPTRRVALLDIIFINEGIVVDVKGKSNLGCSDCEMMEFRILRGE